MKNPTTDADCGGFNLSALVLKHGKHGTTYHGECCVIEASNRVAACIPEFRDRFRAAPFSDDHPSISRVIRSFLSSWNDGLPTDADRTRLLLPYATRVLGTATTAADEETRVWLATDWLVRVQAPAWLDLAKLTDRAVQLRALPPLTSSEIARGVQSVLEGARRDAGAAWAAARAAFAPVVATLQTSALELLDRMIAVGAP